MRLRTSRFQVIMLSREGPKFLFSVRQLSCQNILCQTVASVGVKRFHIVTHSSILYVVLFSIKTSSCETDNNSSAKKIKKETKPMRDSESTSK